MNLLGLARASTNEGKRLAKLVKQGKFTRRDIEDAYEEYHDIEPLIALQYLDKWGIK